MTRGRRHSTGQQERAWWLKHRDLLARDSAKIPPRPDPVRQPREYAEWAQKHARPELSPEWRQHFDELHELPSLKLRKERDREVWSWIQDAATTRCDYLRGLRSARGGPFSPSTDILGFGSLHGTRWASFFNTPHTKHLSSPVGNTWSAIRLLYIAPNIAGGATIVEEQPAP